MMKRLLYIHGFASSPESKKAQETKQWLATHRPDIDLILPQLSVHPAEAFIQLKYLSEQIEPMGLIGSSLGGFYATVLNQRFGYPAVLVNPCVYPSKLLDAFIGDNVFWHNDQHFKFTEKDLVALKTLEGGVDRNPDDLWLMVQTGDETLDYRDAVERYPKSPALIEQGGDHSFINYADHLPNIIKFLEKRIKHS